MTVLPKTLSRVFRLALLIILIGVIWYLVWPMVPLGAPFGYWDAKRDVSQGHLEMKIPMWDRGWQQQWKKNLKEKFNIEIAVRTPSSFNQTGPGSYDHAYNAVQRAEIIKIFGRDVVNDEKISLSGRRRENNNRSETLSDPRSTLTASEVSHVFLKERNGKGEDGKQTTIWQNICVLGLR